MLDRSTKIILLAIAGGLWANVIAYAIRPAAADRFILGDINSTLGSISSTLASVETKISDIESGVCGNRKLCEISFGR